MGQLQYLWLTLLSKLTGQDKCKLITFILTLVVAVVGLSLYSTTDHNKSYKAELDRLEVEIAALERVVKIKSIDSNRSVPPPEVYSNFIEQQELERKEFEKWFNSF